MHKYKQMQRDSHERILDNCPEPDGVPPAPLLYDRFGHFNDIFKCQDYACTLGLRRRLLEETVSAFMENMSNIYPNKAHRKAVGLLMLNRIFSLRYPFATLSAAAVGLHRAASIIVEFKNKLVNITSIPSVELTSYATHLHVAAMELIPKNEKSFYGWRVPCLGLTMVKLPNYHNQGVFQFRILSHYPDMEHYCHLYIAETKDDNEIVVKFMQQTGPKDFQLQATPRRLSKDLVLHCDWWIGELQDLMMSFHGCGLVYGDLCKPNILCNGEKVMLVDFDWGGKAREAFYPVGLLTPELTIWRQSSDLKIAKDDDKRVLENMLRTF
ncbi:hypothetical protein F5148DRAFT_1147481 [Russula earlei]|uniref:Uncharacterized protein n=1 Tax=Russula earlei TaxID=71964 RepID=A0ACC0UFP4_9AGAM|nr:hypothetical protein F5148DRAFT_1147481 [Russula earlei]